MDTVHNLAKRNTNECCERVCQKSKSAKHILDADCCHEGDAFSLLSLPRKLPGLFTVRFTAPADFTVGDVLTLKGREFAFKTRTMEEPEGKIFSAGAVVLCDIDMERGLAFITPGDGVNLGTMDPLMDGTASAGSAASAARSDHIHPSDTSRIAVADLSVAEPLADGEASAGTSTKVAREDHVHPMANSMSVDYSKPTYLVFAGNNDSGYLPIPVNGSEINLDGNTWTAPDNGMLFVAPSYISTSSDYVTSFLVYVNGTYVMNSICTKAQVSESAHIASFGAIQLPVSTGDSVYFRVNRQSAYHRDLSWWAGSHIIFFKCK